MRVFLDFEASSLGKKGYPIEVAWVFEDGRSEAHLIRPAPGWTDWDEDAEALHRISRAMLKAEGTPHDMVAHRLLETLSEHDVFASAPSWDGKWLSALFRAAGLPRHAMKLRDVDEARLKAAAEALRDIVGPHDLAGAAARIVARVVEADEREPVKHRALADAQREQRIWAEVGRLAKEEARSSASRPSPQ